MLCAARTEKLDKLYGCTNRIPLIDSIIEIPIAFILAPKTTLLLWLIYAAQLSGIVMMMVVFIKELEETNTKYDKSALYLSSYLVAYNIFRLTGDVSQYFVIISNSCKNNTDDFDTDDDNSDGREDNTDDDNSDGREDNKIISPKSIV